jgi:Carboxypeptidase regulatory-like domain
MARDHEIVRPESIIELADAFCHTVHRGANRGDPIRRELTLLTPTKRRVILSLVVSLLLGFPEFSHAALGGRISGTVEDPSGAVVPKATVTATNTDTAVRQSVTTNSAGTYWFPSLPVGHYDVVIVAAGFRPYRRANIVVDVNGALLVDAVLELGQTSETVTVNELAVQAETASSQLGEVINAANVTALPLNGRSYTDLLALQPGVVPATTITALTIQGLGQSVFSPSGGLNPGTVSINGQRESANGFMVNGADAEETGSMAAAIIPNLDSIAEFRILSANSDAEYGQYTGGQINVITKSGTNEFHGDAFDFLRNTDLDARNYSPPLVEHSFRINSGELSADPSRRAKSSSFPTIKAPGRRKDLILG